MQKHSSHRIAQNRKIVHIMTKRGDKMKTRHNSRYSCKVKALKEQIAFTKERLELISKIADKHACKDGLCDEDFYYIGVFAERALHSDPLTRKEERRIKCAQN